MRPDRREGQPMNDQTQGSAAEPHHGAGQASVEAGEADRRQPVFNLPGVVMAIIALCAGVHLLRMAVLSDGQDFGLLLRFAFSPLRYSGEYLIDVYSIVSPVTYAFLHGDVAHLTVNVIWLAAFGSPLANRIGTGRFLLFWLFTSLAAVALHFVLHPYDPTPLVGASGAISGMMGAAARFGFRIERRGGKAAFGGPVLPIPVVLRTRTAVTFLAVWMVVNLVMGLGLGFAEDGPRIAWEAHIGGFVAGFLCVRLFDRAPPSGAPQEVEPPSGG
jgi:membrane associated rhomboid family serine protease